jgi:hypothetical protein
MQNPGGGHCISAVGQVVGGQITKLGGPGSCAPGCAWTGDICHCQRGVGVNQISYCKPGMIRTKGGCAWPRKQARPIDGTPCRRITSRGCWMQIPGDSPQCDPNGVIRMGACVPRFSTTVLATPTEPGFLPRGRGRNKKKLLIIGIVILIVGVMLGGAARS